VELLGEETYQVTLIKDSDSTKVRDAIREQVNNLASQIEILKNEAASLKIELEEKAIPPATGDRMLKLAHTVRKRLGDASAENIK
jgi:hypothetical protein